MSYLSLREDEVYEIPTSLLLPAVSIIGNKSAALAGSTDKDELDLNNLTDYGIFYYAYNPEHGFSNPLRIDAVLCVTLID